MNKWLTTQVFWRCLHGSRTKLTFLGLIPKKRIDILINKKKKLIAAAIIILLYLVAWTKISSACCCSVAIWLFVSTSLLTSLSENGCSEPPPTDHVVSHHLLPPVEHINVDRRHGRVCVWDFTQRTGIKHKHFASIFPGDIIKCPLEEMLLMEPLVCPCQDPLAII